EGIEDAALQLGRDERRLGLGELLGWAVATGVGEQAVGRLLGWDRLGHGGLLVGRRPPTGPARDRRVLRSILPPVFPNDCGWQGPLSGTRGPTRSPGHASSPRVPEGAAQVLL